MTGLTVITWIRFFVWLGLGLLIYIGYSRHRSEFASQK
jgi:APA family basic amino acid/polyamine antiporter